MFVWLYSSHLGRADAKLCNQILHRLPMLPSQQQDTVDVPSFARNDHWRNLDELRAGANDEDCGWPHDYSLLRYINAVICSDIRPIRKMTTAALNRSRLMLVNRCWTANV